MSTEIWARDLINHCKDSRFILWEMGSHWRSLNRRLACCDFFFFKGLLGCCADISQGRSRETSALYDNLGGVRWWLGLECWQEKQGKCTAFWMHVQLTGLWICCGMGKKRRGQGWLRFFLPHQLRWMDIYLGKEDEEKGFCDCLLLFFFLVLFQWCCCITTIPKT